MNQDEFNDAERESKLRMDLIHESTKKPKREWVGLTDEDLFAIYNQTHWNVNEDWNYERAIEAKLREKNT
jgi:hypothetical protein